MHEFSACTEFVFERRSHSSHIPLSPMRWIMLMVWLAAVETWKDEVLTDFSAARCMSLVSSLSFTILNASRIFFAGLLVSFD